MYIWGKKLAANKSRNEERITASMNKVEEEEKKYDRCNIGWVDFYAISIS
jgi:hypothetical protein